MSLLPVLAPDSFKQEFLLLKICNIICYFGLESLETAVMRRQLNRVKIMTARTGQKKPQRWYLAVLAYRSIWHPCCTRWWVNEGHACPVLFPAISSLKTFWQGAVMDKKNTEEEILVEKWKDGIVGWRENGSIGLFWWVLPQICHSVAFAFVWCNLGRPV